jgi:hypothetical protein
MRAIAIAFLIGFLSLSTFGQTEKKVNIPTYNDGDTSLWYIWKCERAKTVHLPSLISDNRKIVFRVWLSDQIVDIWTNDYKTFNGVLTNYAASYASTTKRTNKSKSGKIYSDQVLLDISLARQNYKLFKTIDSIPSEDSVVGWEQGCDGVTYCFETSSTDTYSFKSYWTPEAQDSSLAEAQLIQSFIDKLYDLLNLEAEYSKFFKTLKPGAYSDGSIMITIKLTRKQIRKIQAEAPYYDYLDSISDSLNKYLCDTLTNIFVSYGVYSNSFLDYRLRFSSKNKLTKIIRTDNEYYSFADRFENFEWKRRIRKAFRHVDISFVTSKIPYWKTLSIYQKTVTVK